MARSYAAACWLARIEVARALPKQRFKLCALNPRALDYSPADETQRESQTGSVEINMAVLGRY
jgi:hypothetical protein